MKKTTLSIKALAAFILFMFTNYVQSQHTFSIVAVDPVTGEIGSAGATCLDIDDLNGEEGALVISDIIQGVGAIHTQAAFTFQAQAQARARMEAGDSPQEILNWIMSNDSGFNSRQYGIVDLIGGPGGDPRVVGFTGTNNGSFANHIEGSNYSIQGNILLSQEVLDDMETGFLNTSGTLADKLMAALQGAKRIGAQTSCTSNQTSSKSAFLRVAKIEDLYTNYGHTTVDLNVSKTAFAQDPIDVLQDTYDFYLTDPQMDCIDTIDSFPYSESFETDLGLWTQNDLDLSHVGNTDFDWTRNSGSTTTSNTGPTAATNGGFYLYTEASGANVGFPTKRAVLNSPCIEIPVDAIDAFFQFDYHMFGSNVGNLAVRVNDGNGWMTVWLLEGNQGNEWNNTSIDISDYIGQTIQLRLDSTTGTGQRSDVAIDNIVIETNVLGLEEERFNSISVYPNPTTDILMVESLNTTIEAIEIYDISGKLVAKKIFENGEVSSIDISKLPTSIYFATITSESGRSVKRIVKE